LRYSNETESRRKVWLTPLMECHALTLPIYENARLGCKVKIARACEIRSGGKNPRKCIYSVAAQETAKHRAMFGWPSVNDVPAVTKPRCETRRILLGCPKLPNRSQPLVGRSSPYCGNMWRRHRCLSDFFPIVDICLICEDSARQSCAMVPR